MICAGLVGVLLAALAPGTSLWLDVGSPGDEPYISDAFPAERNDLEAYRWFGEQARFSLPVPSSGTYDVELMLAAFDAGGRTLTVSCGEHVAQVPLDGIQGNLTVPMRCHTAGERLELTLDADVIRYAADGRPLGLALRDVRVTPRGVMQQAVARLAIAAALGACAAGIFLALRAVWPARLVWVAVPVVLFGLSFGGLNRPDELQGLSSGPGWALVLIAGLAAAGLAAGNRLTGWAAALGALLVCLAVPTAPPSLLLPALWTPGDVTAARLLPWLVVGLLAAAALLGNRLGVWLAAYGALAALAAVAYPSVISTLVGSWSVALAVPHWDDVASVGGALYVALVFGVVGLAGTAAAWLRLTGRRTVLVVAALVIGALGLWRADVMRFNGDEPHYYVTARSIGVDRDLELLNNYQEPRYQAATISPIGNIAVERDESADRYDAFGASFPGQWFIVQPLDDAEVSEATGLRPADGRIPIVERADGARAALPALTPGTVLALPLFGDAVLGELWIGRVEPGARSVTVRLVDLNGEQVWQVDAELAGDLTAVPIPPDLPTLLSDEPATLLIEAEGGAVVALALDEARGGLRTLAGRVAGETAVLTGLPKDRYALTADRTGAGVVLFNPTPHTLLGVLRLIGPSNLVLRTISIGLPAGSTRVEGVPIDGADAILVEPAALLVAVGSGYISGGHYSLPSAAPLTSWELPVAANPDRDAGVWLTVVNPLSEPESVTVRDGADATTAELCAICSHTFFLEAGASDRKVMLETVDGVLMFAGAVEYEERTASLHFDLLLPLLAAPAAAFSNPSLVLIVPALAGLALVAGLYQLLGRVGLREPWPTLGALGAVLAAPLSTYSVRVYTEIVACALLVWALVAWDAARERRRWLAAMPAAALALVLLHGRLTPLALLLLLLALMRLLEGRLDWARVQRMPRRSLVLMALAGVAGLVGLLVVEEFAVGLTGRVTLSYFDLGYATVNFVGSLLDRGSGLLPFAPWLLLAIAVPRPLNPLQRAALALAVLNLLVVVLRQGGWQTWGSAGRYLLPVVPLLALLAVPGAARLWRSVPGKVAVSVVALWSVLSAVLLHWLPLSGYVWRAADYQIDAALGELLGVSYWLFPKLPPREWGAPFGAVVVLMLIAGLLYLLWPARLVGGAALGVSAEPRGGLAPPASATPTDAAADRPPAPGA